MTTYRLLHAATDGTWHSMTSLPSHMDEHDTALAIAGILEAQSVLNDSVSRALQAVALTADRYDDELALVSEALSAIRARLTDMNHRLAALEAGQHRSFTGRDTG